MGAFALRASPGFGAPLGMAGRFFFMMTCSVRRMLLVVR
jgi:hypothetical protein